MLVNNPVYGHDWAFGAQAAKETFPCVWVIYLVTKVEEETRAALESENGTENIAVWGYHPWREKVYGSGCS